MFENYPDLLTVKELQSALSIGRSKAYEIVRQGDVRSFKIGNSVRIPKSSLLEYIEKLCYNGAAADGYPATLEV